MGGDVGARRGGGHYVHAAMHVSKTACPQPGLAVHVWVSLSADPETNALARRVPIRIDGDGGDLQRCCRCGLMRSKPQEEAAA